MKKSFYPRLAIDGIRKNGKLYLPYLLSCVGTVTVFYILQALSVSSALADMRGGRTMTVVLSLGKYVIAVFALLFLFYTNSVIVKRRYKEFGLYSILGMSRKNVGRIVLWESLISALIGIVGGIVIGIVFSSFAESGLFHLVGMDAGFRFSVSVSSVLLTAAIFGAVFLLLTVKTLWQVSKRNPIDLMRNENYGEKPIKANFIPALLGIALLGTAYVLAITIKSPLTAVTVFFFAVIMVIIGTYLLFTSGSVTLCRILQKNKSYYYKKQHFVSVSNMAYRMKRNGMGLASVCILATMVLVMISSTTSLYFGVDDAIRARFPRNTEITVYFRGTEKMTKENLGYLRGEYEKAARSVGVEPQNVNEYAYAAIDGKLKGDSFVPDYSADQFNTDYEELRTLCFMSAEDYFEKTGEKAQLRENEVLLYTLGCKYDKDSITIGNLAFTVVGEAKAYADAVNSDSMMVPQMRFVVSDYSVLLPLEEYKYGSGETMLEYEYYYGYDTDEGEDKMLEAHRAQTDVLNGVAFISDGNGYHYSAGSSAGMKEEFLETYGGLFFLGIMLSVVFIFAAAVIIYYKQISEGYEDRRRFEIMQNVGMTKTDIRKTVNSQILTVFFAPLVMAGVHLSFAFPYLWKILQLFDLTNLRFIILVTVISFAAFAVFYAVIYKLTAREYYKIVSEKEE